MTKYPETGRAKVGDPEGPWHAKAASEEESPADLAREGGISSRTDVSSASNRSNGDNGVTAPAGEEERAAGLEAPEREEYHAEAASAPGGVILRRSSPDSDEQLALRIDTFGSPGQRVKQDLEPRTKVPSDYDLNAHSGEGGEDLEAQDRGRAPSLELRRQNANVDLPESEPLWLDPNEGGEAGRSFFSVEERASPTEGEVHYAKTGSFGAAECRSKSASWERGDSSERRGTPSDCSRSSGREGTPSASKRAKLGDHEDHFSPRVEERSVSRQGRCSTPSPKYASRAGAFSSTISTNYLPIGSEARSKRGAGVLSGEQAALAARGGGRTLRAYTRAPGTSLVPASSEYCYGSGITVTEEVLVESLTSGESFSANMSASTAGDEVPVRVKRCVPRGPGGACLRGSGMDRFNRFFALVKAGTVRYAIIFALLLWLSSFSCLYPSLFSGWLVNEIAYRKGDIVGQSITSIGLNKLHRKDRAFLTDGAKLSLSRYVTFDEIMNPKSESEGKDLKVKEASGGDKEKVKEGKGAGDRAVAARPKGAEGARKGASEASSSEESVAESGSGSEAESVKGGEGKAKEEAGKGEKGKEVGKDGQLVIYGQCSHEREFVRKSCCFRDMCEVGNLNERETRYFKSLYGATVYDVHFRQFANLQRGGRVIMATATLSLFFLTLVFLFILMKMRILRQSRMKEATDNLGNVSWIVSICLSILGFLLWNYYTGGAVCVDEQGNSKPCSYGPGSAAFIAHIVLSGVGIVFSIIHSFTNEEAGAGGPDAEYNGGEHEEVEEVCVEEARTEV